MYDFWEALIGRISTTAGGLVKRASAKHHGGPGWATGPAEEDQMGTVEKLENQFLDFSGYSDFETKPCKLGMRCGVASLRDASNCFFLLEAP